MKYDVTIRRWVPTIKTFTVDDKGRGQFFAEGEAMSAAKFDSSGWPRDDQTDPYEEKVLTELVAGQFSKENETGRVAQYSDQIGYLMVDKGIRSDREWGSWWSWLSTHCSLCGAFQDKACVDEPCEECEVPLTSLTPDTLAELRAEAETRGLGPEEDKR